MEMKTYPLSSLNMIFIDFENLYFIINFMNYNSDWTAYVVYSRFFKVVCGVWLYNN